MLLQINVLNDGVSYEFAVKNVCTQRESMSGRAL